MTNKPNPPQVIEILSSKKTNLTKNQQKNSQTASQNKSANSTGAISNHSKNITCNSCRVNKDENRQSIEGQQKSTLSFQKVAEDLATIIKKFTSQLQNHQPYELEKLPSDILEPKARTFFKRFQQNKQQTTKTPNSGKQLVQNNSKIVNNLKQASRNSLLSKRDSKKAIRSSSHALSTRSSSFGRDPIRALSEDVQRAIRERKTFTVRGNFNAIRKALLARGWIEKYHTSFQNQNDEIKKYQQSSISELLPLTRNKKLEDIATKMIMSKMLKGHQVDFYWAVNMDAFKENPDKTKFTVINKLKKEIFNYASKQGLVDASKYSYWYQQPHVTKFNHPRSYSLGRNSEVNEFVEDFYSTAAMSLLKWVLKVNDTKESRLVSPTGQIPLEVFDFALNESCKMIKVRKHEDIDKNIPKATDQEWKQFLDYFYKMMHYSNHFKQDGNVSEQSLVSKSNYVLNNLASFYPYLHMDGMMNIWILKPIGSSQGKGIHMCRTLQYVLNTIQQNKTPKYIIQKYIERPLLIHTTKFDIRQWFLISRCSPLTIWIYKQCYLRFSSQTYNLRKLHESIHLTNNSVQKRYKNSTIDAELPSYNMWDLPQFEQYLANIGYPKVFKEIIYPGMKQCINAAVLMHQDKMVIRKNCFELYGADFILTEDFEPWLLEINSCPALFSSTPVTAKMCPKVLEDVVKVVVDFERNNKADTGGFELIYKQVTSKENSDINLEVKGLALRNSYFHNPSDDGGKNDSFFIPAYKPGAINGQHQALRQFGDEIKRTLKNLLQIIHNEKQKQLEANRKQLKH